MRLIVSVLLVFGLSAPALAGPGRATSTVAAPPKVKPVSELRMNPGVEIPYKPERFTWKVTNMVNGVAVSTGPVYVYSFDSIGFRRPLGTIPSGTEIKLDSVRQGGRQHYYSIPFNGKHTAGVDFGKPVKVAWVPGSQIIPTGYSSTAK